jgi:phospholipid/cholesterol/gamma-HCH transport system ATP-binding protein
MSRRVALARAIALDPDLLMYDEPFTGQDPIAMGVLISLIKNLNLTLRTTNIVVSHDIHETSSIADQLYVIAAGKVIGAGTPAALRENGSELIRQFMHGRPDGPVPFHYQAPDLASDLIGRNAA